MCLLVRADSHHRMLIIEFVKEAAEKEGITMDELLERKGKLNLPLPVSYVCRLMALSKQIVVVVLFEISAVKGALHSSFLIGL